jgi:hypothetical protein
MIIERFDQAIQNMHLMTSAEHLLEKKETAGSAKIKNMSVFKKMFSYMDDSTFSVNRDNVKSVIELFPSFCLALEAKVKEINILQNEPPYTTTTFYYKYPHNLAYYDRLCRKTASELLPEVFQQYDFLKEVQRNGHETEFKPLDYDKLLEFHVPKTREAELYLAVSRTMGAFILSVSAPPQTLDKLKSDIFYKETETTYFVLDDKNQQTVREKTKEVHEERLILDPRKIANATMTDYEKSETWTLSVSDLVRYLRDVGFDDIYFYDASCDTTDPKPESARTWVSK